MKADDSQAKELPLDVLRCKPQSVPSPCLSLCPCRLTEGIIRQEVYVPAAGFLNQFHIHIWFFA